MSRKANRTLIGMFVLGAVALLFIAVLVLGSGKFLKKRRPYVLFFDGSLKGLNIGSPVAFRGIRVGEVTNIEVQLDRARGTVLTPVYIELDPERFTAVGETGRPQVLDQQEHKQLVDRLVEQGLRAQLEMQSMVSGQLMINAEFHPDKPVRLVGADPRYVELPTIPTDFQAIERTIEEVVAKLRGMPFEKLMENISEATAGLEKLVNQPEVQESFAALGETLKEVQALASNLNGQVDPMAGSLEETGREARATLRQAAASLESMSRAARAALEQAQRTLAKTEGVAAGDSTLGHQLAIMFEEITAAASSLRTLADTLERRPDAMLRGKSEPGGR